MTKRKPQRRYERRDSDSHEFMHDVLDITKTVMVAEIGIGMIGMMRPR
jgi:hypothetical protein